MCGLKPIASWGLDNKSHREGESSQAALLQHHFVACVRNVTMLHFLMGQESEADNLAGWKVICNPHRKTVVAQSHKKAIPWSHVSQEQTERTRTGPSLGQIQSNQNRNDVWGPDGGQSWFIRFEAQILQTGTDRPRGVMPRGMWAG